MPDLPHGKIVIEKKGRKILVSYREGSIIQIWEFKSKEEFKKSAKGLANLL